MRRLFGWLPPLLAAAVLLAPGCGASDKSSGRSAPQQRTSVATNSRPHRHRPAQTPPKASKPEQRQPVARTNADCPDPSRALDGVYHASRLEVLDPCRHVSGTVILLRGTEEDGDLHFDIRLDPPYRQMLMANNISQQEGGLVVEFMPRDHGHLPAPSPGDRVSLTGAYVDDTLHAWSELHPVWSVSINGGPAHRSGPQYGGSPASALSANALATCRTDAGAPCIGYGGATAPLPPTHGGGGGSDAGEGGNGSSGGGGCTPGYTPCIAPGADVDCAGGGGDGPRYVNGPVHVTGSDPYGLDSDGNGVGC